MITIIGHYSGADDKPSVALGLKLFLRTKGYDCSRIDVRSPDEAAQAYAEITAQYPTGWHHEPECVGRFFVVWSNIAPTEFRLDDGRIFEANDGDVVLIDNLHVQHRPPSNIARWFARAWNVRKLDVQD